MTAGTMTERNVTRETGFGARSTPLAALAFGLAILAATMGMTGKAAAEPIQVANLGGGFIEFLFGGARDRAREAPPARTRPAQTRPAQTRPAQERRPATRSAPSTPSPAGSQAATAAPGGSGALGLAFCVRTCDGFGFPVGALRSRRDAPVHEAACVAACPGAPTRLFVGTQSGGFTQARAFDDGTPYASLPNAFRNRRELVADCSCAAADPTAARIAALGADLTLRRGDVVATSTGALVFDGNGALEEIAESPAASASLRRLADLKLGSSLRERKLEEWLRTRPQAVRAHESAPPVAVLPPPRPSAEEDAEAAERVALAEPSR